LGGILSLALTKEQEAEAEKLDRNLFLVFQDSLVRMEGDGSTISVSHEGDYPRCSF
jgi:hypothetical protein